MLNRFSHVWSDFMDCSPPGSSVHGIVQARILQWVAMTSSRGIFLSQGPNPCLICPLRWQVDSLLLAPSEKSSNCWALPKFGNLWWRPLLFTERLWFVWSSFRSKPYWENKRKLTKHCYTSESKFTSCARLSNKHQHFPVLFSVFAFRGTQSKYAWTCLLRLP